MSDTNRISGETKEVEVTMKAETMGEYNARMDKLRPHCPKSPDGEHVMKETHPGSIPLVIGITGCYTCKYCGYHHDTHSSIDMKDEWSLDELV